MRKMILCLIVVSVVIGTTPFDDNVYNVGIRAYAASGAAKVTAPATIHIKRASNTSLKLTWSKVSTASGYQVYRYSSEKKKYVKVKTIAKRTTVTWTDKKLKSNKTYKYKVRAYLKTKKGKKFSPFTYYVTARAYTKNSDNVNAGKIKIVYPAGSNSKTGEILVGMLGYTELASDVLPSKYGKSKKKKVFDDKIRLIAQKNSYIKIDKKGRIYGKKEGSVNVYMVAHNGNMKKLKITVTDYAKPEKWSLEKIDDSEFASFLQGQKDNITDIASWLSSHYSKDGYIYLSTEESSTPYISNESNIDISGIKSALMQLMEESPYGVSIAVKDSRIDFTFGHMDTDTAVAQFITFDYYNNRPYYTPGHFAELISFHWAYSIFVGV